MSTSPRVHPAAAAKQARFHESVVAEVAAAVAQHAVVVVGMGWNPNVWRARRLLGEAGVAYHYLGYGNYLWGWRKRLAIKLWSGWPTYPQVFVNGMLVGGASDMHNLMEARQFQPVLAAGRG